MTNIVLDAPAKPRSFYMATHAVAGLIGVGAGLALSFAVAAWHQAQPAEMASARFPRDITIKFSGKGIDKANAKWVCEEGR